MVAQEIFMSLFMVMSLTNVIYASMNSSNVLILTVGAITSLIIIGLTTGVIVSIKFLGSGLGEFATRVIFGMVTLMSLIFSLNVIPNFPIGLGLGTNFIIMFSKDVGFGIPTVMATLVVVATLVSGIIMIIGESA